VRSRIVLLAALLVLGGVLLADVALPTASASECAFVVYNPLTHTWQDPCAVLCPSKLGPCELE